MVSLQHWIKFLESSVYLAELTPSSSLFYHSSNIYRHEDTVSSIVNMEKINVCCKHRANIPCATTLVCGSNWNLPLVAPQRLHLSSPRVWSMLDMENCT
jgi:hypothetical protein